jgi:hypothetical protein
MRSVPTNREVAFSESDRPIEEDAGKLEVSVIPDVSFNEFVVKHTLLGAKAWDGPNSKDGVGDGVNVIVGIGDGLAGLVNEIVGTGDPVAGRLCEGLGDLVVVGDGDGQ